MSSKIKYPRTLHLPWSESVTRDDRTMSDPEVHFSGRMVVVTEKMDGENTTIYSDAIHARSLDSADHASRSWVKALQARIGWQIPKGYRICGENVFAKHSIEYDNLPSYFLVFSIWNENNECLSWQDTVDMCALLELSTVPVLYTGLYDENKIKSSWHTETKKGSSEGYVVRLEEGFSYGDFGTSVAKYVRVSHVQPDAEHWMHKKVVRNGIIS